MGASSAPASSALCIAEPVSNLLHRRPRFIVAMQVYRCTAELLDRRAKEITRQFAPQYTN